MPRSFASCKSFCRSIGALPNFQTLGWERNRFRVAPASLYQSHSKRLLCPVAVQDVQDKWLWLKIKQQGQTAGVGPCFHLPGFHFGTGLLSQFWYYQSKNRIRWAFKISPAKLHSAPTKNSETQTNPHHASHAMSSKGPRVLYMPAS